MLERLKTIGYDGGATILKDYVHKFRPPKSLPAVCRYETASGKQAQMDWGITHYIDEHGVVHKTPAFMMILGSSRAKYVEFTKRCDLYSLLRCMVNAFEYFGGVPEVVLTDRMKTVIDGSEAGRPVWNSRFDDFAADMGFVPKVCRARRPQTKDKVERLVDYVKDNFLPGRQFSDINDLNQQAPFEKDGSQLLFQVISECYEKRSVIITTNLEFSKWNGIFYDEKLTSAIIDRLVHHSHLLVFQGQSYRLTHSTMKS